VTEELIPAYRDDRPIGSVMPMEEGKVPESFEPFDGRVLDLKEYPLLEEALRFLPDEALRLLTEWGANFSIVRERLVLPDLDSETVMGMIWGVKIEGAPRLVLAIKAKDES
jgi:hypothetical protein